GAIGFSTDLSPSMTLGCGSWGGNVTSDNVSPIHLMDIKRVAFETKPINKQSAVSSQQSAVRVQRPVAHTAQLAKREQIAALVDNFLSQRLAEAPPTPVPAEMSPEPVESPVKTVIHELRPQSLTENGFSSEPVDFVSENDVRTAVDKGQKIYITAKTILTPSARDLGEEKDIFARV
ncbi:MAG TPA: hypothetical protein VK612_07095, partial [Pyrinomonadaceae bacterium]|nr:hypothetical protein [Pyrinomonadaceae bacterium]